MNTLKITSLLGLIFLPAVVLAQEVHAEVQTALDWQLPKNECKFKLKRSSVTSGMERKYKRAMKKYEKCIGNYLTGLAAEREKMMAVVHHGLTPAQADIIMRHMQGIQTIIQMSRSQSAGQPR